MTVENMICWWEWSADAWDVPVLSCYRCQRTEVVAGMVQWTREEAPIAYCGRCWAGVRIGLVSR